MNFKKLMRNKRLAFTLAEVLITLGIIGVVAAITIPNVVAKFQHKALESQLANFRSNLQNRRIQEFLTANNLGNTPKVEENK